MTPSSPADPSLPADVAGPPVVAVERMGPGGRKRLSAPGLRTFLSIADHWGLSEAERLRVLGLPPRSTYHGWVAKVRAGQAITLSLDELMRLSAVLGIWKGVGLLFPRDRDGLAWLRAPNRALPFAGQSPMDLITAGSQDGILQVRRYLDAWRGGAAAPATADLALDPTPLSDEEVVIL